MNKNLLNILMTFSDEDWKKFADFLESPFFTKGRNYRPFLKYFREAFKNGSVSEKMSLSSIRKKFPEFKSDQTLRNRLSEINKAAEEFLVQVSLAGRRFDYPAYLYGELVKRKLFSNLGYHINQANGDLKPDNISDYEKYCDIVYCEGMYYRSKGDFPAMYRKFEEQSECYAGMYIDRFLYYNTEYLLFSKWGIDCRSDLFESTAGTIDMEAVIGVIGMKKSRIAKDVTLRYYLYKAMRNPSDDKFAETAEKYFLEHRGEFGTDIKTDYFQKMQVYYSAKVNNGVKDSFHNMFRIMLDRLEDGTTVDFSLQEYPAMEFREFVIAGLGVKNYGWVKKFIARYSAELPEKIRAEEKNMALIRMYVEMNDNLNALHLLKKNPVFGNQVNNIDAYMFRIMTLYDLGTATDTVAQINNLKRYLKKENLIRMQKENAAEFLRNITYLLKLRANPDRKAVDDFIASCENTKDLVLRKEWLIKRAQEIGRTFQSE